MINKFNNAMEKVRRGILFGMTAALTCISAYADEDKNKGETEFNNVLDWILVWIGRAGIVLTVWGAVQIALSVSNEDATQRRNGILQLISGLMVMAIGYGAKSIIGY
ncbi:hypothetical protein [Sedimentibacter sp. LTW-03]|uniref:hypothetical protein n=1 Tax=Sedimentibacter sp. LTW-03 TaxID=3453406 RepID=UPI003F87985B